MNYLYDIVTECPSCHSWTMKQTDKLENLIGTDRNMITLGCYTCGHIAIFDKQFLTNYLCELSKIGKNPIVNK